MIWWSYNLFYVVWMLNNLHTSLSSKFDLLSLCFWDLAKGFSYLRLCFEFLKGLLHLIWWICDLFIFVSPLTFTLQTLKLICGESWDLCEFSWLCMLMRTHYVMFMWFISYACICEISMPCFTCFTSYACLCELIMSCSTCFMGYACLCEITLPCYASLMDYACSPYHVMQV